MHRTRFTLFVLAFCAMPAVSFAQTTPDLTNKPWAPNAYVETLDKLLLLEKGHVKGDAGGDGDDDDARVFWWDSQGRVRFTKRDEDPVSIGYRYLTMDFGTDNSVNPDTLDEIRLAAGLPLGEISDGWKASAVVGVGYSGDNLFASEDGLFGIAHVMFERRLSDSNSLIIGAGYDGNSSLFPDLPFPEIAWVHKAGGHSYSLGFPYSAARFTLAPSLTLDVEYAVPYSGQVTLAQGFGHGVSVFTNFTNFFNGFYQQDERREERVFYEMRRAEVGVRYENPDFIWQNFLLDASLVVGYAFDQEFSTGWDVRDLDRGAELSDEPYVGILIRGTF